MFNHIDFNISKKSFKSKLTANKKHLKLIVITKKKSRIHSDLIMIT